VEGGLRRLSPLLKIIRIFRGFSFPLSNTFKAGKVLDYALAKAG